MFGEYFSEIWGAAQCGAAGWGKIWGDPLFSGTILVLSYGLTGILLLKIALRLHGRDKALWLICGLLFLFQAANTPLDLHAFIWSFGKCLAHAQGWYSARRQVQLMAAIGVVIVAVLVLVLALIVFRRNILGNAQLLLGLAIALTFTVIKGISHHDLAAVYGKMLGPFHLADWIELFGIFLAFTAALLRRRSLAR